MQKINLFILAAGFGTRLQPISHTIPKPLLPIMGKPLIQHVLEKAVHLPFDKLGINLHFKRPLIEDWIAHSPFSEIIKIFPEETILNTGGALRNASDFISTHPFLVHNVDILSDIDLVKLADVHNSTDTIATLAVHDYKKFNKLIIDKQGFLKELAKEENQQIGEDEKIRAFTGIALYDPDFLEMIRGETPSVVPAWFEAIKRGYKVGTVDFTGCFWSDLGTPESYFQTMMDQLKKSEQNFFIHPSVEVQGNVKIDDFVSIEKDCVIHKGALLKNCIILPDTEVGENSVLENCIYGPSFTIDFSPPDVQEKKASLKKDICFFISKSIKGHFDENNVSLINTGGSDRAFYRVKNGDSSVVVMVCHEDDRDFYRYLEIAECLKKIGVPVAQTYNADREKKAALMEDLGTITLYDKLKYVKDPAYREKLYRQALDIALLIHTQALAHSDDYPTLKERVFDYDHARWETSYFSERFVSALCNTDLEENSSVQDELHCLAEQMDRYEKTLVHRDFQSQNIVVGHDSSLHVVDFQGARLGPPAYDLVSMLWDPYVNLDNKVRESLVEYYIRHMVTIKKDQFDEKQFRDSLLTARLQRHMQALGAYGFLSLVKGKKAFLKFIPHALDLLKDDISQCRDSYPVLYETLLSLKPGMYPS